MHTKINFSYVTAGAIGFLGGAAGAMIILSSKVGLAPQEGDTKNCFLKTLLCTCGRAKKTNGFMR